MKYTRLLIPFFCVAAWTACGEAPKPIETNAGNTANTAPTAEALYLSVVERPQKIKDLMAARGEQDTAAPTLKVLEPKADSVITSSTVKVNLQLSGDLKGYSPGMDEATHTGNHIHVILDNQAYEAYYNLGQPFELRNVVDGDHILRVFPSRPWHESYKNEGAFQIIKFKVKQGGADPSKPVTGTGEPMSNANTGPTPEGKEVRPSNSGPMDARKPLLTFSRPKGEYKGADVEAIMIDFWLTNAKLKDDGGQYRVRYSVGDAEARFIDKWGPIWLSGWTVGKHTVKLELVDQDGNLVDNGGYNAITRDITIVK